MVVFLDFRPALSTEVLATKQAADYMYKVFAFRDKGGASNEQVRNKNGKERKRQRGPKTPREGAEGRRSAAAGILRLQLHSGPSQNLKIWSVTGQGPARMVKGQLWVPACQLWVNCGSPRGAPSLVPRTKRQKY